MPSSPLLHELHAQFQAMPPVATMQMEIASYDGACLRLQAPLAAHVNDKGCAFGGSMVSLMTLAAWGLAWLRLREAGLEADVFVADTQVRYLAPLFGDLVIAATLEAGDWEGLVDTLRARGRARITLAATVALPDGGIAAQCTARYAAILKR